MRSLGVVKHATRVVDICTFTSTRSVYYYVYRCAGVVQSPRALNPMDPWVDPWFHKHKREPA